MTDGDALLAAVCADPDEGAAALALADYLQEHGAGGLASALRASVARRDDPPLVYAVSAGEYSNYRVCGVFSTLPGAERFAAALRESSPRTTVNDVEVYALDGPQSALDAGLKPFRVVTRADGDDARIIDRDMDNMGGDPRGVFIEPGHWDGSVRKFYVGVWARDDAHAVKIANDKRIAALAAESQGVPS